jgi:hypothetical protein
MVSIYAVIFMKKLLTAIKEGGVAEDTDLEKADFENLEPYSCAMS